ncbi:MAG: hypothetical protein IJK64_01830, partial [Clostridia bacterium]|nr:hypothetical protein [Clostridia bacterium]
METAKDQYGVNWYQDVEWDTATLQNGVTFSGGTLTVPSSSNRADDYTVTLKEKCGSATKEKTVTIKTFDYKVTFKDWDGTTIGSVQTVNYGSSATAPTHPSRDPDATNHYDADGWNGAYSNLTTGAQAKTVTAKYIGSVHTPYLTYASISDTAHKQYCSYCGYVTIASEAHSFGSWTTDTATCVSGGSHSHTCSKCSRVVSESTPVNPANHTNLTHTAAVAATCTTAGNYEYWYCSGCQKYFSNAAGTTEITQASTVIDALDHDWDYAHVAAGDYTWTGTTACSATVHCSRDNTHTTTVTANSITDEVTTAATCTSTGVRTYTAHFAESNAMSSTTTETIPVNPANHTNLQHFAAVAATCTADGNIEYWYCSGCQKYFSNAAGTTEITQAETVIAALNHNYGAWTYLNADQHQRVCANDASHVETENHSYGEWVNQNNGTKICTCTGCGHVKTMYIGYSVTFNGN